MRAYDRYLLDLLRNNAITFFIPPYQRNYEWEISECEVYYRDVLSTTLSNLNSIRAEHFFGSITLFMTDMGATGIRRATLIDGQQRLTTTMLFLIALRNIMDERKSENNIENTFLKNPFVNGADELKIKLKQVAKDREIFKKLIMKIDVNKQDKESPVYKNYKFFFDKLIKEDEKILNNIITNGLNKLSIVEIDLDPAINPWENPQEIFESMNSMGKPLSLADLIRNYILMDIEPDKQDELYENYWMTIELNVKDKISDFVRDYMQTKKSKQYKKATSANSKELYYNFKIDFKDNIISKENFIKELADYSECYAWILQIKNSDNTDINQLLNDINEVSASTAYCFILEILVLYKKGKISSENTVKILKILKTQIIRRRICSLAAPENKNWPLIVKFIPSIISSENIEDALYDCLATKEYNFRLPNDLEIETALKEMNFYTFEYSRFILQLIEEKITKIRPNKNFVQKEHIMPQNIERWKSYLGKDYEEIHEKYLNNIGNITLISHNQEASNAPFEEKKKIYEMSEGYQISRTNIINKSKWTDVEIRDRANWIIKYIINEVIPIPEKYRKANNYGVKTNGLSSTEIYKLTDNSEIFTGYKLARYTIVGENKFNKPWKDFLVDIAETLYTLDKDTFLEFLAPDPTAKKEFLSTKAASHTSPREIGEKSGLFIETHYSAERILNIIKYMVDYYKKYTEIDLSDQIEFTIQNKED